MFIYSMTEGHDSFTRVPWLIYVFARSIWMYAVTHSRRARVRARHRRRRGLDMIATAKISYKFSRESTYKSKKIHGNPLNSRQVFIWVNGEIFEVWSPPWAVYSCETWLVCMCAMTHLYMCHNLCTCVLRLLHNVRAHLSQWDMTRLHVCHDSFIYVSWLIHMCAVTQSRRARVRARVSLWKERYTAAFSNEVLSLSLSLCRSIRYAFTWRTRFTQEYVQLQAHTCDCT